MAPDDPIQLHFTHTMRRFWWRRPFFSFFGHCFLQKVQTRLLPALACVSAAFVAHFARMFFTCLRLFPSFVGWCYVSHVGIPCVGDLAGIFPSSSDAPVPCTPLVLAAIGRSGLHAQACEEDRVTEMCAWGRPGQIHKHRRQWHFAHVQICPGDQEYGWMGNRPCGHGAFDCRRLSHAGLSSHNDFVKTCVSNRHGIFDKTTTARKHLQGNTCLNARRAASDGSGQVCWSLSSTRRFS